jgi:hypothetical protein
MPKANVINALGDHLVSELATGRAGGSEYPTRLDRLVGRLPALPPQEAVLKAVANKRFTSRALSAVKGRVDAPVALLEDAPALAASPLTLEAALRAKGESGGAVWSPKQLSGAVHKDLRAGFLKAVGEWVESNTLPPFAVAVANGKSVALYHRDRPPPPPKSVQDAERLVEILRRGHPSGEAPPLVTPAELEAAAGLTPAAFKKAVKEPAFAGVVTQVKVKPSDVYLISNGDEFGRLVTGPLLTRLLGGCPTVKAHAFATAELTAQLTDKPQQKAVAALLNRSDLGDELPPGIGCVRASVGKGEAQNLFFPLEHLRTTRAAPHPVEAAPVPAQPPADFLAAFDAAFARLDRERGSNNFVSLVDLRPALSGVPREAFDFGLQQLRRERKYVLTSDERYDGLTPEQQAAAIREEGEFLLHVSRGRS